MTIFCQNLRKYRTMRQMGANELADASGLSESHIRNLESGRRTPTSQSLTKLANALQIPVGCLISESTAPELKTLSKLSHYNMHSISRNDLDLLTTTIGHMAMRRTMTANQLMGQRLRSLRTERGFSQKELAKILEVSPSYIANMESGHTAIPILLLQQLCDILGIEPHQIFRDVSYEDGLLMLEQFMTEFEKRLPPEEYDQIKRAYFLLLNNFEYQ